MKTLPRFLVPDVGASSTLALPDDEAHHLRHVLRLVTGAEIRVFDGRGREWDARVATIERHGGVQVEIAREVPSAPEPPVAVTLGVGLLKGDQMDGVVRDATMLGVTEIAPVVSDHVTVSPRAWRSGGGVDRWRRVAIASAKQCGRAVIPAIVPVQPLAGLLSASTADLCIVAAEPQHQDAVDLRPGAIPSAARALVLIGPEGGWSADEMARLHSHGARAVRLGPRTLRAEAAPAVLLSALWTIWGW